jgi:uncharacterized membrane protein
MILEALRAIVGFALVLFIPGYAASWALFPNHKEIDWVERIALSFGLSISLVVLSVFVINYAFEIPINLVSSVLTILFITLFSSGVYYYRTGGGPQTEKSI